MWILQFRAEKMLSLSLDVTALRDASRTIYSWPGVACVGSGFLAETIDGSDFLGALTQRCIATAAVYDGVCGCRSLSAWQIVTVAYVQKFSSRRQTVCIVS